MNEANQELKPSVADIEEARAIMATFIDDEYLATKLGLEDAIATALAKARAPTDQPADLDGAPQVGLDWALRELADGWIDNNQREGPHGFYQNARRVLELILADCAAPAPPSDAARPNQFRIDDWSLPDVLIRLADAADHLMRDHNCDEHGHEGIPFAAFAARHYAATPAPSDAAVQAATVIVNEVKKFAQELAETDLKLGFWNGDYVAERVQAIISRHFPTVPFTDQWRDALQKIVDDAPGDCGCDHTNENCCAQVDYYCPFCIAAKGLMPKETT